MIGGEARAYPLRILHWHEVVNDVVGGVPIVVTYGSLTDSVRVFDRRVGGATLRFGASGLLNDDPIREGVSAALTNGGIDGFVHGAAIALPRGLRINAVSPTVLEESLPSYGPYFRGYKAVPAAEVALGYARSVEGAQTGRIYRIGWSRDV